MKNSILISFCLFLSSFLFSQTKEDTTLMWFKYISKVDGEMTANTETFISKHLYANNLTLINTQIKEGVLTNKQVSTYQKKTNEEIQLAMNITFWHVLKYNPSIFLNSEYISFIENEIKNNDFKKEYLVYALNAFYYNITYYNADPPYKNENPWAKNMSHDYDALFFEAIKRWGIEELVKNYR